MKEPSIVLTRAQLVAMLAYVGPADAVVVSQREGYVHARRVDSAETVCVDSLARAIADQVKTEEAFG